ncbi:sorbosone dehydrogenase, partial [Candidatus Sumerlaeota bacterium]|nr:sorbosone dehydrogenase [Candidatus Sumerlaeota bacterium]
IGELLDELKSPEGWTRLQAKRVLKERAAQGGGERGTVLNALRDWTAGLDPASANFEHDRLEALWMYQSLDVPEPKLFEAALKSKEPRVRAAAARIVPFWADRIDNPEGLLAPLAEDEYPRARLEAVRALGQLTSIKAAGLALRALDKPMDRFLDFALWTTMRETQDAWLPGVQSGDTAFAGSAAHLVYALQAVGSPSVVQPLLNLLRDGKIPADQSHSAMELIGAVGGAKELALVFDQTLDEKNEPSKRAALLDALTRAAEARNIRPEGDLARIAPLVESGNEALRSAALRAAGVWKLEVLKGKVRVIAGAKESGDALRRAAMDGLASFADEASRMALQDLTAKEQPFRVRVMALNALASVDERAAAESAVEILRETEAASDPAPIFNAFLQRKEGSAALAVALKESQIPSDVAKIGIRRATASGRVEQELLDALTKAGGLGEAPPELTPEQMGRMVEEVKSKGDAARGEKIFRNPDLKCLTCHSIGGSGGKLAPDLTSIGGSAQIDYLIEALLYPAKAVKDGYQTTNLTLKNNDIISGIKVRETDTDVILRDSTDMEMSVPISNIVSSAEGLSLMPQGLTELLTHEEFLDLVRFLSALGREEAWMVGTERIVRTWRAVQASDAADDYFHAKGIQAAAGDDPALLWGPAYSDVRGELSIEDLPRVRPKHQATFFNFARFQIEVTTPGEAGLKFNSTEGLTIWVDARPVKLGNPVEFDLATGVHEVTLAVNLSERKAPLRCEMIDLPGSRLKGRLIGGK